VLFTTHCLNDGGDSVWKEGQPLRLDVFTAVKIQVAGFWVLRPYSDAVGYQHFGGSYCLLEWEEAWYKRKATTWRLSRATGLHRGPFCGYNTRVYLKSFRTESITKYTLTFGITRWDATQRVMAGKITRLTHKIAIQLHIVAESCTICNSRSRWLVRKLVDTPSYSLAVSGTGRDQKEARYTQCEPLKMETVWSVGILPHQYTVSKPRRPRVSCLKETK
jgi:hypothetical protein